MILKPLLYVLLRILWTVSALQWNMPKSPVFIAGLRPMLTQIAGQVMRPSR